MSDPYVVDLLEVALTFVYGAVAFVAFLQWRRRPGPAGAWLTATFSVLFLVLAVEEFLPESGHPTLAAITDKVELAVIALFPYCLYRFMTSFIKPGKVMRGVANVLTLLAVLGAVSAPSFDVDDEPETLLFQLYFAVFALQWVLLCATVAINFWSAGRGQPKVARRRMRTLSVGAVWLAAALVVGFVSSFDTVVGELIVYVLASAAAPLMLIGFAPPYAIRMAWRKSEEALLRNARSALMEATTTRQVTGTLLESARLVVGARGAFLQNGDGMIEATDGLDEYQIHALEASGHLGSLVRIPMNDGRVLTVVASPLTPFFGQDEIDSLEALTALAALGLARAALLDTQRRLAGVVESSDDAITSAVIDGTVTTWNAGAERLYGYAAEDVIGRSITLIAPPGGEGEMVAILERIKHGETITHHETKRRTKDGRIIDVSLTVSPLHDADGYIVGASTIARDVTERKRVEAEREAAREEADRANRAKSEFLSRMSHELRTPLNSVLGFAQLLEMDPLEAPQRRSVEQILKAGRHLLDLIEEVLDIARIEKGRLTVSLQTVDPREPLAEAVELVRPLADRRNVRLSVDDRAVWGRSVVADRQRLRQVLLNLLANAIKFNNEGGSVAVSCSVRGAHMRIGVSDTGIGFSPSDHDRLFVPFERLETTAAVEGTGIGLALSKTLVELMGGRIDAASTQGRGSTFWIDLALAEAPIQRKELQA